jgi:hypothetical protein
MEPLDPVLRHVEEELEGNLKRACANLNMSEETTGELERLGETLDAAARQAKAAAAIRRRMRASDVQSRLQRRLTTPPEGQPGTDGADPSAPGLEQ